MNNTLVAITSFALMVVLSSYSEDSATAFTQLLITVIFFRVMIGE